MAKAKKRPTAKKRPIDPKVHRRILRFVNAARTPEELLQLQPNFVAEVLPPGRERPAVQDPLPLADPVPLFDQKTADHLFAQRDRISPLFGFSHSDQILTLLTTPFLRRLWQKLIWHFSGANYGEWTTHGTVTINKQTIVPRHAALLRTGNVIMIEGACADVPSRTWLWNPKTRAMVTPPPAPPGNNLYCSGHSFLRDGRLLAFGGGGESNTPGPKNAAWIFDPDPGSSAWEFTKDVNTNVRTWGQEQRWYPTLVTLGDHRVLVASGDLGHIGCGTATTLPAMRMEIYDESTGRFEHVTTPTDKYFRPTYPGLHLLPNHQMFFAPVGFRDNSELTGSCAGNESSSLLSISGLNGTWTDVGAKDRTKGMSVILLSCTAPSAQVMIVGGGDATASRTYTKIDLSSPTTVWGSDLQLPLKSGQAQPTQRIHPNVVLLPDGTVLVAGGAPVSEPCWLYDPSTLSWQEMDELNHERRYHSFALLLPTAEVMACGGRGQNTAGESVIEVFRPPYLFRGPQPTITGVAPDPIHHGSTFTIQTPNAAQIAMVTLVRPMAVTHQTDSEQRVIPIAFSMTAAGTLTATGPSPMHPHGLAPRGWYMLFVIDNNGVPSKAKFVHLH